MKTGLATARLLALFVAGWLLFNAPLISLWDHLALWGGWPLFPAMLFVLWLLLIGAVAVVSEKAAGLPPPASLAVPAADSARTPLGDDSARMPLGDDSARMPLGDDSARMPLAAAGTPGTPIDDSPAGSRRPH
jgi:hypothetical protein